MQSLSDEPVDAEASLLNSMIESLSASVDRIAVALKDLSPEKRQAIASLCAVHNLSQKSEIQILWAHCELAEFQELRGASAKTPKERAEALLAVASSSRALYEAIAELSLRDSFDLHLLSNTLAEGWPLDTPEKSIPVPTAMQLETVGRIAQAMASEVTAGAGASGRRPTLPRYAAHVGQIWRAVRDAGISPGRGGEFEKLCDEIFSLAGVPSKAEGAVRYFNEKLLPRLSAANPVSESFDAAIEASIAALMEKMGTEDLRKNPP